MIFFVHESQLHFVRCSQGRDTSAAHDVEVEDDCFFGWGGIFDEEAYQPSRRDASSSSAGRHGASRGRSPAKTRSKVSPRRDRAVSGKGRGSSRTPTKTKSSSVWAPTTVSGPVADCPPDLCIII